MLSYQFATVPVVSFDQIEICSAPKIFDSHGSLAGKFFFPFKRCHFFSENAMFNPIFLLLIAIIVEQKIVTTLY